MNNYPAFRKGVPEYTQAPVTGRYQFYCSCVNWPRSDVHTGLIPMIDEAIEVARSTFLKHVDKAELRSLEESLGYESHPSRGLTMAGDGCVTYHRSKLHGKRVYFFRQSGIEYVFHRA